jgi:ABC-2 type transport system ATP-binding protein
LDELKHQILGPVEYEAQLSHPWQLNGLTLPKGVTVSENNGSRLRFRVERPQETNPLLLRQLTAAQAPVVTLQEVSRSLEQVYLKVMADAQAAVEIHPAPAVMQV